MSGDVHFQWQIQQNLKEKSPAGVVGNMPALFKTADLRIVNLETPISTKGLPEPGRSHVFNAPPGSVAVLAELGVQAAVLANNHAMDMGAAGLDETIKTLTAAGIMTTGAGKDVNSAMSAALFRAGKLRIALVAGNEVPDERLFAGDQKPGIARGSALPAIVAQLKTRADIVIVSVHWGIEYHPYASPEQIALARQLVRSGASVVFGHHPHSVQGVESGPGYVVAYSLGNFLFGSTNPYQSQNALLLVEFDESRKTLVEARFIPLQGEYRRAGHVPELLSQAESQAFMPVLLYQSKRINPAMGDRLNLLPAGGISIKVD